MSYLSLFIAFLKTHIEGQAWLDAYLNNLVAVERWFFHASLWVIGAMLVIALILAIVSVTRGSQMGFAFSSSMGCLAAFLIAFPALEWVTWQLAKGMASSVDPTGILNQGKFVLHAILYVLIGVG